MTLTSDLKATNRQLRLFNKALEKQIVHIKDRLKAQDLLLESFSAFLGFRAHWLDDHKLIWQRIDTSTRAHMATRRAMTRVAYAKTAKQMKALKRERDFNKRTADPHGESLSTI